LIRNAGLLAVVALAGLTAGCDIRGDGAPSGQPDMAEAVDGAAAMEMAVLSPAEISYYPPGEYLENGFPVTPSPRSARFDHGLQISARQVSQAEYAQCVQDGGCRPLDRGFRDLAAPDMPAVGVSWRDATDYAAWLSARTGRHYRLPAYEEWVYAAGAAYKEDVILEKFDPADPAQRWLAEYALETQRKATVDATLRVFGGFGRNEHGLLDMAGNVWDWTDTCFARHVVVPGLAEGAGSVSGSAAGGAAQDGAAENCGIRVVAGPHRSYITDFMRDPKAGACSVGVPPSHLGFRLVLDAGDAPKPPGLRERLGIS
jgi:formylglycine-generating enzyme required for sulfatase activity